MLKSTLQISKLGSPCLYCKNRVIVRLVAEKWFDDVMLTIPYLPSRNRGRPSIDAKRPFYQFGATKHLRFPYFSPQHEDKNKVLG